MDGLNDYFEFFGRSLGFMLDTDDDGLKDGEEIHTWCTNVVDRDTEDDGFWDGFEVNFRFYNYDNYDYKEPENNQWNHLDARMNDDYIQHDLDDDKRTTISEIKFRDLNPFSADTDGDGITDETDTETEIDGIPGTDFGACKGYSAKVKKEQMKDRYMHFYNDPVICYNTDHKEHNHDLQKRKTDLSILKTLLLKSGVNTCCILLDWMGYSTWEYLREFLFWAREHNIKVILTLRGHDGYSAPFGKNIDHYGGGDFPKGSQDDDTGDNAQWARWGKEIGYMSNRFPEIIGVVVDDFDAIPDTTKNGYERVQNLVVELKFLQPYVAVLPVCYERNVGSIHDWLTNVDVDGFNFAVSEEDEYDNNPNWETTFTKMVGELFDKMQKEINVNIVLTSIYFSPYYGTNYDGFRDDISTHERNIDLSGHQEICRELLDRCHESIEDMKMGIDNQWWNNRYISGVRIRGLQYYYREPYFPDGRPRESLGPWWRDFWIDICFKLNTDLSTYYPISSTDPWEDNPISYLRLVENSKIGRPRRGLYQSLYWYLFPYEHLTQEPSSTLHLEW